MTVEPTAIPPTHWPTRAAWTVVKSREEFGGDLPLLSMSAQHGVRLRPEGEGRAASDDTSGYRVVAPGDLVVNRLSARDGAYGISGLHGLVSPAYWVLQTRGDVDPRWLDYVLRSAPYRAELIRISKLMPPAQFDLPWDQFRKLPIPVPPASIQSEVADYLDAETARIDALIEKKQRIGELLDERGRIEAVRLVTGQRADVDLAEVDSDVYGVVPGGWRSTALRHLGCTVQTGPFGSQLHADEYVEGGWPVVNPMNLVDGGISPSDSMTVSDEKRAELARHILRKGDIVFGRRGEMGRAGIVTEMSAGWLCGTGSLRLRLHGDDLDPRYLQLLLGIPPARAYFELASVGTTMDNLNSEIVLAFPCLVPPCDEQSAIVEEVNKSRCRISQTRAVLARQIALLNERRQALITTAVTGKLDQEEFVA